MRAVALIVAMSLVGACSSSSTSDSTTTTSTAPGSTTTSAPTTTTTLEAIPVWVRAHIEPEAPDNGYEAMNSIVVFEGRLVAVGTAGQLGAVWVSSDGLSWSRLPDAPNDSAELQDLIVGGPGLVAVGSARTEDGGLDAAVWTSTDGLIWSRVSHDPAVFGEFGSVRAVAAGPEGLVAVGFHHAYSEGAVWTSPDGLRWSLVPDAAELLEPPSFRSLEDVVAFDGGFVAVGSVASDVGPYAATWLSPDGLTWSQIVVPTVSEMKGVAVADGRLVAVGWQTTGAAAWVSEDGIEWTRIGGTSVRPRGSEMRAVLATRHGLVAVGYIPESGWSDGAIWQSADGTSWSRVESPALGGRWSQEVRAGAEFAGGIALVGTDSTERGGITQAAWFIGPSTAVVPMTTTTQAPQPTIVTPPDAPEFQMRCGEIMRSYESPPPTTFPNCGWRVVTDPWWTLARWKLDPDNPPDPTESVLHVLATETACAGGAIPEGREIRSALMSSGNEVVVFVLIEPSQFPMNCPGNPSFPMTINLDRPLGELTVYEGFLVPPLERYPAP